MPWGAVIAALPWKTIIEEAPGIVSSAYDFVRSIKSPARQDAISPAADRLLPNGKDDAIKQLEEAVATLEAEVRQAADIVAELARSHAAVTQKLEQTRKVAIGTAVLAVAGLGLAMIALSAG